MGKASRDKGARREREFAKLIGGTRVPLSGAMGGAYSNDVTGGLFGDLRVEVKARADGWKQIYDWLLDEREKPDILALKADKKPWLVVMTLDMLRRLLHENASVRPLEALQRAGRDKVDRLP